MGQGIGYQALLRGADGEPLLNHSVALVFQLADSAGTVWSDTVNSVTDAHGLVSVEVGALSNLHGLPWHRGLVWANSVDVGNGFEALPVQPTGLVPVAAFAGNGFYLSAPDDARLAFDADTVRFHADSLLVLGNVGTDGLRFTENVRLQAETDVILTGRDDVVGFATDQVKLNAGNDVLLNATDDVRLEALDDIRLNAANELELVGLFRTNVGTAAGITPTTDTTTVMAKRYLNLGIPLYPPMTGTPADTLYLTDQVNIGGEAITVYGPATFMHPVSGAPPTTGDQFVTLDYLNSVINLFTSEISALQAQVQSLHAVVAQGPNASEE